MLRCFYFEKHNVLTFTTGFDTDEPYILVRDEVVERADGVTPPTYAGDDSVRELAASFLKLVFDLLANDLLEVADKGGERVRSNGGSDKVVCG